MSESAGPSNKDPVDRVKKNIVANLISQAWAPLVVLLAMPFYVGLLGMEAVGLVGLYVAIQALARPLDAGLGMTLARELARLSVQPDSAREMRNLLRTLATLYWAVAAAIGLTLAASAPLIARWWVRPDSLSTETVTQAIALMGLALGLQWPSVLYQGGLTGLQHQVSLATINVVMVTARFLGVIGVLRWVSPTIQCYFLYQAGVLALHTVLLCGWLWWTMPRAQTRPRFRWATFKAVWRLAAGIGGVGLAALVLTQADKIILSKMLPLEGFGAYSVAAMAAMGLYAIFYPVFAAMQPRFTQLVTLNRNEDLAAAYHGASQLVSVLMLPAAAMLVLFSPEILALWIGRSSVAADNWLVLSFLAGGTCLYGLFMLPYALQLAYGWTRLAFTVHAAAAAVLVPLLVSAARLWGPAGAAAAWALPNAALVLLAVPLMHRRLMPDAMWRWLGQDIALPLGGALLATGLGRAVMPRGGSRPAQAAWLGGIALCAWLGAALAAPQVRARLGRLGRHKPAER